MAQPSPAEEDHRSRLHGLTVAAPFPLAPPPPAGSSIDVRVAVGVAMPAAATSAAPTGRTVARWPEDRPYYTVVEGPSGGFTYRLHRYGDISIAADLSSLECHVGIGVPEDLLPVYVGGQVLAALLLLRGELVMHASAVERDGRAVALVGASGAGKTTIAAMACAAGARIVTDDVLRVEPGEPGVRCWRGATQLRLRPDAAAMVGCSDVAFAGVSADGRQLLPVDRAPMDEMPLTALFVPHVDPTARKVGVTAINRKDALFALVSSPRILGWQDARTHGRHFSRLAELVEQVPTFRLDVPAGATGDRDRCEAIADALLARA